MRRRRQRTKRRPLPSLRRSRWGPRRTPAWDSPPARPTNLQASGAHDEVTLTWSAATDQTVTHHAVLRRNRDPDAVGLFHVTNTG